MDNLGLIGSQISYIMPLDYRSLSVATENFAKISDFLFVYGLDY